MTNETKPAWTVPPDLAQYTPFTIYGDRAEELHNSPATPFNNTPAFAMSCETQAEWRLLARLRREGLLRDVPPAARRHHDERLTMDGEFTS
ncbi:hypothetical protein AB0M39_40155 [Streptomyces sp. NPDC051907]|uniref:hypothetical protein n=1 Tax=Streptomyces sp. NPDC051907 TaxID=3155284 RepID=UPI003431A9E3